MTKVKAAIQQAAQDHSTLFIEMVAIKGGPVTQLEHRAMPRIVAEAVKDLKGQGVDVVLPGECDDSEISAPSCWSIDNLTKVSKDIEDMGGGCTGLYHALFNNYEQPSLRSGGGKLVFIKEYSHTEFFEGWDSARRERARIEREKIAAACWLAAAFFLLLIRWALLGMCDGTGDLQCQLKRMKKGVFLMKLGLGLTDDFRGTSSRERQSASEGPRRGFGEQAAEWAATATGPCEFARDGQCDEGKFCAPGTDSLDCACADGQPNYYSHTGLYYAERVEWENISYSDGDGYYLGEVVHCEAGGYCERGKDTAECCENLWSNTTKHNATADGCVYQCHNRHGCAWAMPDTEGAGGWGGYITALLAIWIAAVVVLNCVAGDFFAGRVRVKSADDEGYEPSRTERCFLRLERPRNRANVYSGYLVCLLLVAWIVYLFV